MSNLVVVSKLVTTDYLTKWKSFRENGRRAEGRQEREHERESATDFLPEVRQSLHNSDRHINTSGLVARVTRGSRGPALPRRVSHSDVIGCRWRRAGPWPIGQRHRRAQPVLVSVCFFFSHSLSFSCTFIRCPLTRPLNSPPPPISF